MKRFSRVILRLAEVPGALVGWRPPQLDQVAATGFGR